MLNGFVSKRGFYDKLGMNTSHYREIIPRLKDLTEFCRSKDIPIFYIEAVKEASGIGVRQIFITFYQNLDRSD
jgi:ureidoacrylate peracid hydrolase